MVLDLDALWGLRFSEVWDGDLESRLQARAVIGHWAAQHSQKRPLEENASTEGRGLSSHRDGLYLSLES